LARRPVMVCGHRMRTAAPELPSRYGMENTANGRCIRVTRCAAAAKQTHREGRVELRAIIGTDGTVRSLEIVAGDPLLERSAVRRSSNGATSDDSQRPGRRNRYVITVIYTMQH